VRVYTCRESKCQGLEGKSERKIGGRVEGGREGGSETEGKKRMRK